MFVSDLQGEVSTLVWTIIFNSFYRDEALIQWLFVCWFRNTTRNLCSVNIGSQGPSTFLMVTSWSIVIAQQKATGFAYLVKACGNKTTSLFILIPMKRVTCFLCRRSISISLLGRTVPKRCTLKKHHHPHLRAWGLLMREGWEQARRNPILVYIS